MSRLCALALAALLGLATLPGSAVEPGEALADPALEARARALSRELRCLVCQNQSIDDSNAELARDLRRVVRERLLAGDSDAAVLSYLTSRYGDFVLLRPPVRPSTYVLWLAPVVALAIGAAILVLASRRRRAAAAAPLTAEERARLERLLANDGPP